MKKRPGIENKNILRIIDVNLNRANEGLRVCEDVVRFILDDAVSTERLKALRHKIRKIISSSKTDYPLLYEHRNIKTDVGIDFFQLEKRSQWQDIFFANMQRVKESLRVLEEFFKLFDDKAGRRFKALRFEAYDAEKKIIKRSKTLSDSKHKSWQPTAL